MWSNLTLDGLLTYVGERVDVVVLNTILWADAVASNLRALRSGPYVVWILHEIDIVEPPGGGWWYGDQFPALTKARLCTTVGRADAVVFVAEAQRALWLNLLQGTSWPAPALLQPRTHVPFVTT